MKRGCRVITILILFSIVIPVFTGLHLCASNLEDAKTQVTESKVTLEELEKQLESTADKLTEMNAEVDDQEAQGQEIDQKINEIEITLELQRIQMKKRMQYIYENGDRSFLTRVLEAHSWSQMVNELTQMNELSSYDRSMFSQYEKQLEELEDLKKQTIIDKETLKQLLKEQEQTQEKLTEKVEEAKTQITESEDIYQQLVEQAEAREEATRKADELRQEEEYQAYLRAEAEEADRKEAEELAKAGDQDLGEGLGEAEETTQLVTIEATAENIKLLATIIQCESGNQPYEGQLAVGSVVINRVNDQRFPNTIKEVIATDN